MKDEEFALIVQQTFSECANVLAPKGIEYARGGDRLHNFRAASEISGRSPEQELVSFWLKHVVSIKDMADDVANGKLPSDELMREKTGDAINYMVLLRALIIERKIGEKE